VWPSISLETTLLALEPVACVSLLVHDAANEESCSEDPGANNVTDGAALVGKLVHEGVLDGGIEA